MDHHRNAPRSTTSSRDSLIDYLNGGQPPTRTLSAAGARRSRWRACPVVSLIVLLTHLIVSGAGVALSVLVIHFGLQVHAAVGASDVVARILLFSASCMGFSYVCMHALAAREKYVRGRHTSPHIFRFFAVGVAVLLMRFGVLVWAGAAASTALVVARKGVDLAEGIRGNVVWVQLGIAALGL